jgi:hypothetical protein
MKLLNSLFKPLTLALFAAALVAVPARAEDKAAPERLGVQELLKDPSSHAGKKIVLEGFVTEYCKRKGCWAVLHDKDSDAKSQIRVKQDEDASNFKPFLPEVQGKTVAVTGELHETKIDKDYLDKWEARVKESAAKAEKDAKGEAKKDDGTEATLKQITALRERVAKSSKGYLKNYSFAGQTWELVAAAK